LDLVSIIAAIPFDSHYVNKVQNDEEAWN
jgi:hypothetical protein